MNICPVRAELFHADGQTDRHSDRFDKDYSHSAQFYERDKNGTIRQVLL